MRFKLLTLLGALALITGGTPVSASSERRGELHLTKECSQYTGLPGSFCTFTKSNLAAIKRGSRVFYDQADGIPTGMLDSNVVLDAGSGNRAVGRCTLDDTDEPRTLHVLGRHWATRGFSRPREGRLHVSLPLGRDLPVQFGGLDWQWYAWPRTHRCRASATISHATPLRA